jgi:hypothetical protein
MNKNLSTNENIAYGHKISRKGWLTLSSLDFLFVRGLVILQGVLHSSSLPDCIEDKKSGGVKQSKLLTASAGNDLRMSTMRPNPYLSAVIVMRRGEI